MTKQPPRNPGEARDQPQGEAAATVDVGTGSQAVNEDALRAAPKETRAEPPAGAAGVDPDAVQVDHSGRPDALAEVGPVPSENVGEDSSPVLADPDWQARAEGEEVVARAQQGIGATTGDVRNRLAEERIGAPEDRRNADVHALDAELAQQAPTEAVLRVTAADPGAWIVTRSMGLTVYVPVRLDLTEEQVKSGLPRESYQPVIVAAGEPLPEGTPLSQLENLRLLRFVAPASA